MAMVVAMMLTAAIATGGGPAVAAADAHACGPLPESVDIVISFELSGYREEDPDHSHRKFDWNQSVQVEGTLYQQYGDGVYNVAYPGSKVKASGSLSHSWSEVYKKTDIIGEGGAKGGELSSESTLRLVVKDDSGTCRFFVSYQPLFDGVQFKSHYSNKAPQESISGEGFGSFVVHGELNANWTGQAGASGTIPLGTTTLVVGDDELNGPSGTSLSVEVALGERPLTPSAELVVEHLDVPSLEDWVEVPPSGTFEGNVVRLTALVGNPSTAATAEVTIRDASRDMLIAGPVHVAAEAGENEYQWELATEGLTWDDGERADDLDLRLEVKMYGMASRDQAMLAVNPRPVVLVHGWNSNAAGWDGYAKLLQTRDPDWEVHAVGDGRFEGTMQTGSIANPLDRGSGLVANAGQLGTYVEDLRDELDAQRVDLVAHSMGGLISRYYVAMLMAHTNGTPVATRLLMLGTPNLGSPCASIIPHSSAFDLDPAVIAQFNAVVSATYGVQLAILAGDAWPTTCHVAGEGDMVVQVESAFALPYVTDRRRTGTDHVSMTRSVTDAEDYVLPRLTRSAAGDTGRVAALSDASVIQANASAGAFAPIVVASGIAEIDSLGSVEIPITVDALDRIGATVAAIPGITAELVPPALVAAAVTTTTDDKRTFASTDAVESPVVGNWTLRLTSNASERASVAYAVAGYATAAPTLAVEASGDGLVTTVTGVAAGSIATVEAVIVDAHGRSTVLPATVGGAGRHTVVVPTSADGATVVVTARGEGWQRVVRAPVVDGKTFPVQDRRFPDPIALVTSPEPIEPDQPSADATTPNATTDDRGDGLPVVLIAIVLLAAGVAGGGVLVLRRRWIAATRQPRP